MAYGDPAAYQSPFHARQAAELARQKAAETLRQDAVKNALDLQRLQLDIQRGRREEARDTTVAQTAAANTAMQNRQFGYTQYQDRYKRVHDDYVQALKNVESQNTQAYKEVEAMTNVYKTYTAALKAPGGSAAAAAKQLQGHRNVAGAFIQLAHLWDTDSTVKGRAFGTLADANNAVTKFIDQDATGLHAKSVATILHGVDRNAALGFLAKYAMTPPEQRPVVVGQAAEDLKASDALGTQVTARGGIAPSAEQMLGGVLSKFRINKDEVVNARKALDQFPKTFEAYTQQQAGTPGSVGVGPQGQKPAEGGSFGAGVGGYVQTSDGKTYMVPTAGADPAAADAFNASAASKKAPKFDPNDPGSRSAARKYFEKTAAALAPKPPKIVAPAKGLPPGSTTSRVISEQDAMQMPGPHVAKELPGSPVPAAISAPLFTKGAGAKKIIADTSADMLEKAIGFPGTDLRVQHQGKLSPRSEARRYFEKIKAYAQDHVDTTPSLIPPPLRPPPLRLIDSD